MIELVGVSKTVTSGAELLTILHPLDLRIPTGRFVAIVGPSGSGKSTLLGLVAGLDAPTTGRILIDEEEITNLGEDRLARLRGEKIGFVFQFFHLVPSLTAFENVLLPMEIAGISSPAAKAGRLLEEMGLTDRGHHYPSQLSGGEQQRVAIARALANDPTILLADEPTGNLDSKNGRHIIELLSGIHVERKTTLVLATHDRALAARAEVVLSLSGGTLIQEEPSAHLPLGTAVSSEGRGGGVPATEKETSPQRPIQDQTGSRATAGDVVVAPRVSGIQGES